MPAIKLLHIDIETAPGKAYIWSMFKENIPLVRLIEPGYMLCFTAKWEHEKVIIFHKRYFDPRGNNLMLEQLWDLLDAADAVIHYNGKSFDIKHIQREFVIHDFLPPSPFKQIDLLTTVRSQFKFQSNKMEHVAKELKLEHQKMKNDGFDMWIGCMEDDDDAWEAMKDYNIQDVRCLADMYTVLKPWIKGHPNVGLYMRDTAKPRCVHCGSTHGEWRGTETTRVLVYRRWNCLDCGAWSRARKSEGKRDKGTLR